MRHHVYLHHKHPSWSARLVSAYISMRGMKQDLDKAIHKQQFQELPAPVPERLTRQFTFSEEELLGRKVWIISPKMGVPTKTVMFLHGGAYVNNLTKYHWDFVAEMAERTRVRWVVPDYPLAPAATYRDVYAFVETLYRQLLERTDGNHLMLMGDSAGGGLALGFAQYVRELGLIQPSQLILLSPWLDLSVSHHEIRELDRKDPMLSVSALRWCGLAYAGDQDLRHYQLSPVYGNLKRLGKIALFIGTHDLLLADCRYLHERMEEQGVDYRYYKYPKMVHDWMLIPWIREAKRAIEQIVHLING
jgi:acetyl esterase/lipase